MHCVGSICRHDLYVNYSEPDKGVKKYFNNSHFVHLRATERDPATEEELDVNRKHREWRKTTSNANQRRIPIKYIYSLQIASFNL